MKATQGRTLDHVAWVYDALSPLMLFGLENRLSRECLKWLTKGNIQKVLDVGCGTGSLTITMAKTLLERQGSKVSGIDAAPRMIEVARSKSKNIANISFDVGIAESLPYKDNSFDMAVSTFFFHHINFGLKQRSLNEIWRVLKNGAEVVIIDVDIPTTMFGKIFAWAGYYLFQQEEIRENIEGKLRQAIEQSKFKDWERIAVYQGYISLFKLKKEPLC